MVGGVGLFHLEGAGASVHSKREVLDQILWVGSLHVRASEAV